MKLPSFQRILIITLLLTILHSCATITHEIEIYNDKSGKMTISAELPGSKFMDILAPFIDIPVSSEYEKTAKSFTAELNKMKGISEAKYEHDKKNKLLSISCRFSNTKYFNKALYKAAGSRKNFLYPSWIKARHSSFTINDMIPYMRKYYPGEYKSMLEKIPAGLIDYSCRITIPGEISGVSNSAWKISKNRKSATFSCKLDQLVEIKLPMKCKIRFQPR